MSPVNNVTANQDEFDFELVSREGTPLHNQKGGSDRFRYMGALEDNMTSIRPPIVDSFSTSTDREDDMSHRELTPG